MTTRFVLKMKERLYRSSYILYLHKSNLLIKPIDKITINSNRQQSLHKKDCNFARLLKIGYDKQLQFQKYG